ncbi:MAG TPA: hypothetical protein VGC95_11885 [Chitinophagaceae bacterium]
MVIGNGMIATRFEEYRMQTDWIIFASGVSNSKTAGEADYRREKALLRSTIAAYPGRHFVYFSTCSFYDPALVSSRYVSHKKDMEHLIREQCQAFSIFRVSNLVGPSENPNTVLNFFVNHVVGNTHFDLWENATRNLLDLDDMFAIVNEILQSRLAANQLINIASPLNYTTLEIVQAIERHSNRKANYSQVPKGTPFSIDTSDIAPLVRKLGLRFDDQYLPNLLRKYYGDR